MKHHLHLDYTVPVGDLAPYFDALQNGDALASACSACGAVAFPARTQCGSCAGATDWKPLTGAAHVVFRTDGPNASFALVKFDGADTHTTVGLVNPETTSSFGRLVQPLGATVGLWVMLEIEKVGNDEKH